MNRDGSPGTVALDVIKTGGLVPLYSSANADLLYRLAQLVAGAGIPVLEVTMRAPGAVQALSRVIARVEREDLPVMVGAGTVLGVGSARAVIEAGARFIFSPVVDPAVGERCRAGDVAWIPGCATPTEIHTALDVGCVAVKLFPADTIGGPGFLSSVRSVLPGLEAIPSGGIVPDAEVLRAWFRAGACAVAMGSRLFPNEAVTGRDWSEVERRLHLAVSAVAGAREGL
jgi:2-dehydro-3-deoxyphosphogluconate aldolase/(4S)-4-hydroxy-2-oxoglutarate aldolase